MKHARRRATSGMRPLAQADRSCSRNATSEVSGTASASGLDDVPQPLTRSVGASGLVTPISSRNASAMNSTSVALCAFQPNLPTRPSARIFIRPRTASGWLNRVLSMSTIRMLSRSEVPRSVMALRFENAFACGGMPVGRPQGTPSSAIECCRAIRAAASEQWIERSGFHVRDAEYERVRRRTHPAGELVAGHVVMAGIAAVAVEQRTEPFVEPELLREDVLALRGGAGRAGDPRCVDRGSSSPAPAPNAGMRSTTP